MPYYRVDQDGIEKPRVVRAMNASAALRHVSEHAFTVSKPLNTDDLLALTDTGIRIERAGEVPTNGAAATEGLEQGGGAGTNHGAMQEGPKGSATAKGSSKEG